MSNSNTRNKVILALDNLSLEQALDLARKVQDMVWGLKIHSLFDEYGPEVVQQLRDASEGCVVWVDAKLHDIPKTVGLRAKAIAKSGADIVTVHASGGIEMMKAAAEACYGLDIYAVTVLTSLTPEVAHLTYGQPPAATALQLARDAQLSGVTGVVCSPQEVKVLAGRPELEGLEFIVPGVRSSGSTAHDQQRVDTLYNAIVNGATKLVVGRQVTEAADPVSALSQLELEITSAISDKEAKK